MSRLVLVVTLTAITLILPARARAEADAIFYGGPVETLNANDWRGSAIAVRGGRVIDVGRTRDVMRHRGPRTKIHYLGGRAILPGFVDAHTHLFNDAAAVGLTLDQAQALALQRGVTTLANLFTDSGFYDTIRAFAPRLRLRLSLYLAANNPCNGDLGDWWKAVVPNFTTTDLLRVIGVKIFADGGSCQWPATTFPMPDDSDPPDAYGNLYYEYPEMRALVGEIAARGFQIAVHAYGDRSRDVTQTAIADLLGGTANCMRHRIEHNTIMRPDQIAYYKLVGIVPVVWGRSSACAINKHLSFYWELPAGDESWWWPWQSMLDAGLQPAWHSDWYRGVPLEQFDPIQHLYGLTTRKAIDPATGAECVPPPAVLAQAVSLHDALRMMTSYSAYALHMESAVGTLEPGKLADFVVLDGDPAEPGYIADDVKNLHVLATFVGGVAQWCDPSVASLLCH